MSANVEWTFIGAANATTDASSARTGGFGFHFGPGSNFSFNGGVGFQFASASAAGPYFARGYVKVIAAGNASSTIMAMGSGTGGPGSTPQARITLETNRTLILRNQSGTQIGSASSALSLNTWYMVELKSDASPASGSRVIEGRLGGSVFATSSTQTQGNVLQYAVGGNINGETVGNLELYWDDLALNDSTGASQTSYPGEGHILHLRPSATGDANGFGTQTGGTAGSTNNWTRVSEIAPDDATSFNGSAVLNTEDLFKVTNPAWVGLGGNDTISVVMVGARMRNNTADATTALKLEIEKTTAGTIAQSAAIVLNTTTWSTNATAVPHNYPLILYQDPDASNWIPATLATAQVGYKLTTAGTNRIEVTTIWMSVDFIQYTGPATSPPSSFSLMGLG